MPRELSRARNRKAKTSVRWRTRIWLNINLSETARLLVSVAALGFQNSVFNNPQVLLAPMDAEAACIKHSSEDPGLP